MIIGLIIKILIDLSYKLLSIILKFIETYKILLILCLLCIGWLIMDCKKEK